MTPALYVWEGEQRLLPRAGVRHNMIVPYGAYSCADGDVMFAIQTDREWRRLCADVLDEPAMADDPRYATNAARVANRQPLEAFIGRIFGAHTLAQVTARLEAADIPMGAVNDVPSVRRHPQLAARQRWAQVASPGGMIPALIPPHNMQRVTPRMGDIPALGQHTTEVLAELKLS
jgi:crotonobetainyl-CoA:carnitine CoA-transferase CaiB-like acyl-CoA transferase